MSGGTSAAELARVIEALLFLSPDPVPVGDLIEASEASEVQVRNALDLLAEELAPGRRGLVLREVGGGFVLATDPAAELPARRLLARPKTPPLTAGAGRDAGDRRLPAAGLAPGDRADPRRQLGVRRRDARRAWADRGVGTLPLRRGHLPDHRAVRAALRPRGPRRAARRRRVRPDPRGRREPARAAAEGGRAARRGLRLDLEILEGALAIARLGSEEEVPEWAEGGELSVVARTGAELFDRLRRGERARRDRVVGAVAGVQGRRNARSLPDRDPGLTGRARSPNPGCRSSRSRRSTPTTSSFPRSASRTRSPRSPPRATPAASVRRMRLAKYLAHCGVASRRASERLIADGRVSVGGEVVTDPARDVDAEQRRGGRRRGGPAGAARGLGAAQARERDLDRARAGTAACGHRPRPLGATALPGRPARRRLHRADPADQRRRARQPAHPSPLRGPEDVRRAAAAAGHRIAG